MKLRRIAADNGVTLAGSASNTIGWVARFDGAYIKRKGADNLSLLLYAVSYRTTRRPIEAKQGDSHAIACLDIPAAYLVPKIRSPASPRPGRM